MPTKKQSEFWQPQTIEELAAEQGVEQPQSIERLFGAGTDLWDSDEEFDKFLDWIENMRTENRRKEVEYADGEQELV